MQGRTVVMVTHDLHEALRMAHQIHVLRAANRAQFHRTCMVRHFAENSTSTFGDGHTTLQGVH